MFGDLLGAHSFVASIDFPVFLRGFMFSCKLLINLLFLWKQDKVCEELFGSRQAQTIQNVRMPTIQKVRIATIQNVRTRIKPYIRYRNVAGKGFE